MKTVSGSSRGQTKLHHRVEAKIMRTAVDLNQPRLSAAEARRLVEDLQIHHQVELELQNQTLLEMRQQVEQSLKRYTDLYDFAPVGYATLASDGAIQEINRAGAKLLGMECAHLIERRLGLFVSADTRPVFNVFLEQALVGVIPASCEVVLALDNAPRRHAQFEGIGVESGEDRRCRIALLDITERKQTEENLRRGEEQYRAVIETAPDGFLITDARGHLLEANDAYVRLSGYSLDELRRMTIADLDPHWTSDERVAQAREVMRNGGARFETRHRAKNGRVWAAEISGSYWPIADGRFFSFIRDINRRNRSDALLKFRLRLSEMAVNTPLDALLQTTLDMTKRFTGSAIAFFHFVDPDQEQVILQFWSSNNTLQAHGKTTGEDRSDPINQSGVWVDDIRQRRSVTRNDRADLLDDKGLPEGHAPLIRELTVPILRNGGQPVAILGVANKPEDYTEDDLEAVRELADMAMGAVERKWIEERITHLAYHDALTFLPNRALLTDRLQQAMAKTLRTQQRLAVCYLDLDDFKPINDTWGHARGDQVLIDVAQRLKSCVRVEDTVARLGGDEFVLLLGDLNGRNECERTLNRVLAILRVPFSFASGPPVQISASLGVTLYPDDHAEPNGLLRHADQAMYAAKQAGGGCSQWSNVELDCRARTSSTNYGSYW